MPGKDSFNPSDVQKTTTVVAFFNMAMMPVAPRLGAGPSSVVLVLGLGVLSGLGKSKQAGSGWFPGWYSSQPREKLDPDTIIRDVFKGGGPGL